jgi:hypothetical protein
VIAISAFWPSVNGAGGKTSSAEAPPAAAVRPDAVHDRELVANLRRRDLHHSTLLVRAARGHFGRMGVDGERRKTFRCRDVAQMGAEVSLVDGEFVVEWQQDCRNNAGRDI